MAKNCSGAEGTELLRLQALLNRTIYLLAESLRNIGILLQPFTPTKAQELLDVLGVSLEKRTAEYVGFGKDFTYGKPMRSPGRGAHDGLFPPLDVEN